MSATNVSWLIDTVHIIVYSTYIIHVLNRINHKSLACGHKAQHVTDSCVHKQNKWSTHESLVHIHHFPDHEPSNTQANKLVVSNSWGLLDLYLIFVPIPSNLYQCSVIRSF